MTFLWPEITTPLLSAWYCCNRSHVYLFKQILFCYITVARVSHIFIKLISKAHLQWENWTKINCFLGFSVGPQYEKTDHWWFHHPKQVPFGSQAHQPEVVPWTLPCETVSPTEEVSTQAFSSACHCSRGAVSHFTTGQLSIYSVTVRIYAFCNKYWLTTIIVVGGRLIQGPLGPNYCMCQPGLGVRQDLPGVYHFSWDLKNE